MYFIVIYYKLLILLSTMTSDGWGSKRRKIWAIPDISGQPTLVAGPCNAEAPHRFECFSLQGILHGLAPSQLLGI
jgi:hypothetical protein